MRRGIWFGTRRSKVQILSPRPFLSLSFKYFTTYNREMECILAGITAVDGCQLHGRMCQIGQTLAEDLTTNIGCEWNQRN